METTLRLRYDVAMRPFLVFILGLSLTTFALFPTTSFAKNDNVVFVCATEGESQTVAPAPKQGFFGSLFGFLKKKEATTVYIDCSQKQVDSTKETETPEETETDVVAAEPSFLERLKKFFSPPSFAIAPPKTASPSNPSTPKQTEQKTSAEIEKDLLRAEKEANKIYADLEQLKIDEKKSKYFGMVSMNVSPGRNDSVTNEYISLSLTRTASATTSLTITGLTLQNARGMSVKISGATTLPFPGRENALIPVTLRPGDRAIVSTGFSPNGLSFQENLCTGYFSANSNDAYHNFNPTISRSCPQPRNEPWVASLSWNCKDYLLNQLPCRVPTKLPLNLDAACQEMVTSKLTYNGCVETHRADKNFYSGSWRIYLGRTAPLWHSIHETITLLDAEGKIIASVNFP